MRVFVVGATGVIGRELLPLLVQAGHRVRALARRPDAVPLAGHPAVEVVQGDLLAPDLAGRLPALLDGCEAAMHLATAIPKDPTAPGAWEQNTRLRREGTRRLLDAALAAGVRRYLQQSIVMAYADGGDRWLDESAPFDASPAFTYRVGPVADMEAMVRAVPAGRLAWCILRGGSFVGPDSEQDRLLAELRAGHAVVPGDGSAFFSPVHWADFASACLAALEKAPPGSTFNVADEPLPYGEYLDRLAGLLGLPPPPRDPRLSRVSQRVSSQAAREVLGWAPRHGLWPEPGRRSWPEAR